MRLKENEPTDMEWRRKARDAVNQLLDSSGIGGKTSGRPIRPQGYASYFDTDLGVPVWWNGAGWVNASGTAV